jgi:hypothetical protein
MLSELPDYLGKNAMFRGFNVTGILLEDFGEHTARWHSRGEQIFADHRAPMKRRLDAYTTAKGPLDGSRLRNLWFPKVDADIFISHSHDDEDIAKTLAGWFDSVFGLKSFIDSCVWGYAGDLLRTIDNANCRSSATTYDYNKRNGSTSHVHMMLSTALGEMIDNTECIMFLNTPNSIISSEEAAESRTQSPWIYSELATIRIVGKKPPERQKSFLVENFSQKTASARGADAFRMWHEVNLESLTEINKDILIEWGETKGHAMGDMTLDTLYGIAPEAVD